MQKLSDYINEIVGGVFICLYNMYKHIMEGNKINEVWICTMFDKRNQAGY